MLTILIVDDTIVYRSILRGVIEAVPGCAVAATAANGADALECLKRGGIDVVLLDVEMPVMDGLETLRHIRHQYPAVKTIMVSAANRSAADITIRALELGALDFIPKPETGDPAASKAFLVQALQGVLATCAPAPRAPVPIVAPPRPAASPRQAPGAKPEIVVIGVSTGGPVALTQLIPALPADLGLPIAIVQHMPPVFTESLARNLDRQAKIRVFEGKDAQIVRPNEVYIAPGGKHMLLRRAANGDVSLGLNENPPESNCRPAADVLFRSAAAIYGPNTLTVVMTGMGTDGREGARALRRQGAMVLTQDEASCVVYGMPRAIVEAGLSDESVPLDQLAGRITSLVRGNSGDSHV